MMAQNTVRIPMIATVALLCCLTLSAQSMAATASGSEPTARAESSANRWPAVMAPAMRSSDMARSIRFYTESLGMRVVAERDMGDSTEVIFAFAGKEKAAGLILFHAKGADGLKSVEHGNTEARVVIGVTDVVAIADKLKEGGYRSEDIQHHDPYKILIAYDPDGYKLEIVEHPAQ
jgi:lactoylglutathione lyase